jgi:hypothetical protein
MGLRPLRIELLAVRGETDEAWDRLARLPADTGWQRFERAALTEWVLWWTDGPDETAPMAAAIGDVEDDERRLVARALLGAARARRAAARGGDAVTPLAELRADLGTRPSRYAFGYGTGVVVSVVLIGLVALAAVVVAAAVMR